MDDNQKYILISKIDRTKFEVNQEVINSSELLKNICDLTNVNTPIEVECSSKNLELFICFINNPYKYIFKNLSEKEFIEFIQDTCVLDCDVLLDTLADIILKDLKNLDWVNIQTYWEIEDDFAVEERFWIGIHKLEFFLGVNSPSSFLKFPLPCTTSFYSFKWKFQSPMNVVLARVCQRANELVAFQLSQVCKTLKNECDRYPLKLSIFTFTNTWWNFSHDKQLQFRINVNFHSQDYFEVFSKRKIIVKDDNILVKFDIKPPAFIQKVLSLDFIIPQTKKPLIIYLLGDSLNHDGFDSQKCPFKFLDLMVNKYNDGHDFDAFYDNFIARELSKEIYIVSDSFTTLIEDRYQIKLFKPLNALKFQTCEFKGKENFPAFKNFVKKYMNNDGIIYPFRALPHVPLMFKVNEEGKKYYNVADVKKFI